MNLEVINLDCITQDAEEMAKIADILTKLGDYAFYRSEAMKARLAGNVEAALRWEKRCGRLYQELPETMRW